MAGFENQVLLAKNVNFDFLSNPPHNGIITADGQILIGSATTTPNVAITAGNITSTGGSVAVTYSYPNINLEIAGGGQALEHLTGNDSVIVNPDVNHNINILGTTVAAGTIPFQFTGAASNLTGKIQRSQALAAADSTKVGLSNFDSARFTVDANGFVSINGAGLGETITGDSGGALNPTAGNWNIIGQQAGTVPVVDTIGAVSTLSIENRSWLTQLVVDPSSTVGLRGTFTTIQSAITAAVSGQNIYVRPGIYTENLTLKAGINIVAFRGSSKVPSVVINGNATMSVAGTCNFSGLRLQTNSAPFLTVSGSAASIVNIIDCDLNCLNNTGISFTSSNAGAAINVSVCTGDIGTTGIGLYSMTSAGTLNFFFSTFTNSGASTTASSNSAGIVKMQYMNMFSPLATTATGVIKKIYSYIDCSAQNTTPLTTAGTGITEIDFGGDKGGTASAISIGAGTTVEINSANIYSTNAAAIAGAGTLIYSNLNFENAGSTITTTTQTPNVRSNDAVKIKTPGSYPYTTIPQDAVILVDSSSARTIVPLASPTTGQVHTIKDNVGSAAVNNITITPSGKNIDGAASYTIASNYGSVTIVFNGTQWNII